MAKDSAWAYVGGRTLAWLKVKQANYRIKARGWAPKEKLQFPQRPPTSLPSDYRSRRRTLPCPRGSGARDPRQ